MKVAYSISLCALVCVAGLLVVLFCADGYDYYKIFNPDALAGPTTLGVMDYATLTSGPYKSNALGLNYLGLIAYDFATSYEQPCTTFHRPDVLSYQRFEYHVLNGELPGIQCVGAADYQKFLDEHDYTTARGFLITGIVVGALLVVGAGALLAFVLIREKRSRAQADEDRVPIMADQQQSIQ